MVAIMVSAILLTVTVIVPTHSRTVFEERSYKCPPSHYVRGVNTTADLATLNVICHPLPKTTGKMFCTSEAGLRGSAVGAMCRPNSFLTGISIRTPKSMPNDQRFTFHCCEQEGLKIVENSCYTATHHVIDGQVHFKEDVGDVIRGVGLLYDNTARRWTWRINVCLLHGLSNVDQQSYKMYPSAAARLYGESSSGIYSSVCGDREIGSVVYKIDSIVGENNRDRGFHVHCKDLNKLGLDMIDMKPVAVRLDIPEAGTGKPENWVSGCKGHEILTGINSMIVNGVRRYEFLCYTYSRVEIDAGTCKFVQDNDDLDHAVQTYPDSEWFAPVFRGIGAQYLPLENDRRFAYETCMAYITRDVKIVDDDSCRFGVDMDIDVRRPIPDQTVYLMYRTSDLHQCAKMCNAHPFCFSFVWQEGYLEPNKLNCGFSYKKNDNMDYCKKRSIVWGADLPRGRKVWVSCFSCPAISKEELMQSGMIVR